MMSAILQIEESTNSHNACVHGSARRAALFVVAAVVLLLNERYRESSSTMTTTASLVRVTLDQFGHKMNEAAEATVNERDDPLAVEDNREKKTENMSSLPVDCSSQVESETTPHRVDEITRDDDKDAIRDVNLNAEDNVDETKKLKNISTRKNVATLKMKNKIGETTTVATVIPPQCEGMHSSACRTPEMLSLPVDALHAIASFLKPAEWYEFGQASSSAHRVCREIVRRVRMHGFKCATEIVTAWKLGHHEDAKELAALYISEGVPVYPNSLGHSYHTILWRMQTEIREAESNLEIDPFYELRSEFRTSQGVLAPYMTYLEVKSLFWMHREEGEESSQARTRAASLRTPETSPAQELVESRALAISIADQDLPSTKKNLQLTLHQHLLDQHLSGRDSIEDHEGSMVTPPVSLSADFYHTHHGRRAPRPRSEATRPSLLGAANHATAAGGELDEGQFPQNAPIEQHPFAAGAIPARRMPHPAALPMDDDLFEPHQQQSPFKDHAVMDLIDLEAYSAASVSASPTKSTELSTKSVERSLQACFETYQRRLEKFLARGDSIGFDECILDFWDENFPSTAGFQYYDRHTAVPRISCMRDFLTKPCPKSVGTVQCEIERIKTSSRGKGVNMKGRLFPTYEYRLFIRNQPHNPLAESAVLADDENFTRRDTVLMVAKNRGRRHTESSGVIPMSSPKKGSNNYFLHIPQQTDVDAHFKKVNGNESASKLTPNGASYESVIASSGSATTLLGRLQSNFIGTEFQIFTPRLRKSPVKKSGTIYSPSDDEIGYDSGVSSDNNSSRRSRFGRLSLRRTSTPADPLSEETRTRGKVLRTVSSPDITPARHGRAKRRAIANTPETQQQQSQQQHEAVLCEEEDGVITYTANLLGSRPRIMDVCIPKVSVDGVPGAEWKLFLEAADESEDLDMLTAFRQLLQRIEQQEQNPTPEGGENDGERPDTVDDSGLLALQNRPPWWNMELGSFVLNFGGRVSVASVKNFQLCDRHDQDTILLQFGRIEGRHSFTMDFQHPLTAVQAFSIAISSLQSKISFG